MALGNIGAFTGTAEKDVNYIEVFENEIKNKHPSWTVNRIRQMSIEVPEGTTVIINGVNIVTPSSGILQFGYDVINFNSLIFTDDVDVNIIYIY
ncbi:MAG: hypothetical protein ACI4RF_05940 [Eubacterium sp.]